MHTRQIVPPSLDPPGLYLTTCVASGADLVQIFLLRMHTLYQIGQMPPTRAPYKDFGICCAGEPEAFVRGKLLEGRVQSNLLYSPRHPTSLPPTYLSLLLYVLPPARVLVGFTRFGFCRARLCLCSPWVFGLCRLLSTQIPCRLHFQHLCYSNSCGSWLAMTV